MSKKDIGPTLDEEIEVALGLLEDIEELMRQTDPNGWPRIFMPIEGMKYHETGPYTVLELSSAGAALIGDLARCLRHLAPSVRTTKRDLLRFVFGLRAFFGAVREKQE